MILFDPSALWNRFNTGYEGLTLRVIIDSAYLQANGATVKFLPGFYVGHYIIEKCYIGHQAAAGDPYDFDGNQVQLFWSGAPDLDVVSSGLWSDYAAIDIDMSKNLILSFFFGNPASIPNCETCLTYPGYYKSGDDAATTDATGYSEAGYFGTLNVIEELDVPFLPPKNLSGTVKVKGSAVERVVRSYIRSTGVLYHSTVSNPDGTFTVGAPDTTTDMFVVAFDDAPGDIYNDLIYGRVKGV